MARDENAALGIVRAGFLIGVAAIATAVVRGAVHGADAGADLKWAAIFGGSALGALWLSGRLGLRLLLRARLVAEVARGNVAAGIAGGAHYAATGLVAARCFGGDDLATLAVGAVFFVVAQACLHLLLILFRALTSYADDQEILGENVAAALSYAGATVAIGIMVGHATDGPFAGWLASLLGFARALGVALVLYPVRQLVVARLLRFEVAWRGGELDRRIAQDRNVGYAAVEAAAYVATALVVTGLG